MLHNMQYVVSKVDLDLIGRININKTKPFGFDVRGSVHHSIVHTERSNKMQQFIKVYYSMFI
jgi:hypothetical protein